MAIRGIVLMGDPVLRTEAEEVSVFDDALKTLVRDMFETMYHADGIGLAAPQIGLSQRVIVVDLLVATECTSARIEGALGITRQDPIRIPQIEACCVVEIGPIALFPIIDGSISAGAHTHALIG